jgi:hypothetical protein
MQDEFVDRPTPFGKWVEGMWVSSHRSYYTWIYQIQSDAIRTIAEYNKRKTALLEEYRDDEDLGDILCGDEQLRDVHEQFELKLEQIIILSCMSLEGFVNYYGIRTLGNKFYQRNIERLGITEKIPVVLACSTGKLCLPEHELIKNARTLFDKRNQLVHPKSRKVDPDNLHEYCSTEPAIEKLKEHLRLLESFIELFCSLDSTIDRNWEFSRNGNRGA